MQMAGVYKCLSPRSKKAYAFLGDIYIPQNSVLPLIHPAKANPFSRLAV
jgi:hypothetical protein